MMMNQKCRWRRSFPNSANNFDLSLVDSLAPEADCLRELPGDILAEKHRGSITLASHAALEFQRWFEHPDTPLKSPAYVSLSNWFLTTSGDRKSMVATRCENLWDTLFPCRPPARLSSPQPGRNHVMIPAAFERFWQCMTVAQGADLRQAGGGPSESNAGMQTHASGPAAMQSSTDERVRAVFDKEGLHFEVEGSPRALSDFLQFVSQWEINPGGSR
jgi:hypothetical protein